MRSSALTRCSQLVEAPQMPGVIARQSSCGNRSAKALARTTSCTVAPDATVSTAGLPRARALYGTIPEQLADPSSFLSHLATILRVRDALGIAIGQQADLATSGASSVLGLVHVLPSGALELTALNFAQTPVTASFASSQFAAGARLIDAATGADVAVVDDLGVTTVPLEPLGALALVLR